MMLSLYLFSLVIDASGRDPCQKVMRSYVRANRLSLSQTALLRSRVEEARSSEANHKIKVPLEI